MLRKISLGHGCDLACCKRPDLLAPTAYGVFDCLPCAVERQRDSSACGVERWIVTGRLRIASAIGHAPLAWVRPAARRATTRSAGRFIYTVSLSDREQQLTLNPTVAATCLLLCLLVVRSPPRGTKREFSFRSFGAGRGAKKLLGLDQCDFAKIMRNSSKDFNVA
jgi:hypothetical protein